MPAKTRTETDSMGPVAVPADAPWGAQTQRALDNFRIGERPLPWAFISAVCHIKAAAALTNAEFELLETSLAEAIVAAADKVLVQRDHAAFPVDVYQTGSGTSTNMNVNEVLATLASQLLGGRSVTPNDHVNLGQSSNDVIPSAIHLACRLSLRDELRPALAALQATLAQRSNALQDVTKTGRTHLMDAMPLTLGQEISAWHAQIDDACSRLDETDKRLQRLALGGTAVGTGVNTHPGFGERVARHLTARTGSDFTPDPNPFRALATQDTASELAGQLKTLAVAMMKLANDLRWMNSGPLAGLGEIRLEALQPGSSIMPGKVNPVLPEAVAMACARIMGLDTTVTVAAQSGQFQLNVMLPVIADSLLEGIGLAAGAASALERTVAGFQVDQERIAAPLARNPILVTALNPEIGYLRAAEIARRAYDEQRPILEVALEMTDLSESRLRTLLDPARLTRGGLGDR